MEDSPYLKFILPWNFVGGANSSKVPGQPIYQIGKDYIITYSILSSQEGILNSGYFSSQSEEAIKFISPDNYNQQLENVIRSIVSPTLYIPSKAQYVWFQDVANISFHETSIGTNDVNGDGIINSPNEYTTGHIAIGQLDSSYSFFNSNLGTASAVTFPYNPSAFPQSPELKHGDIFFNSNISFWSSSEISYLGSQQFKVILEELIHSLGVDSKVPGIIGTYLDNQKYTVAAYQNDYAPGMFNLLTGDVVAPHTLQLMDIAALQELYGRNYTKLAGNTEFTLSVMNPQYANSPDKAFLYTIWDGNGTDTINASQSQVSTELDIRQGRFSSIGRESIGLLTEINKDSEYTDSDPDPGNVAIAYYTVIENAIGTGKDDTLIGNAWNNRLEGGAGNDRIYGAGEC